MILTHLKGLKDEEIEKIAKNIERFSNTKVSAKKDETLAEAIANSKMIAVENGNLIYLEEAAKEEEKFEILAVKNEAKRTVKLFLGDSWVHVDLDGKNRHIQRIRGMRLSAKKIGYAKGEMEGIELHEYSEENDINFYIQSRYITDWSNKEVVTEENIKEATGDIKALLDRAVQEFLDYRRNGLSANKEEQEKKK